ncbi:capsule assembly Wzi family protein [Emticicia sp. BO119]|uniref:capsule assembly Wzi family protein n=1 Tax=Emticicia sp. BO119 TaxID=2757768 RepID=UPI0015F0C8BB|nr:capsule assembly Wzi family protein [Emticicia sp. BO119]MBA4853947.1 hypothetical protein [Emticicia sp. BO119]
MIKNFLTLLSILFFLNSYTNAQNQKILSDIKYQVGTGTYLSGKTPFWMRANKYGLIPIEGPFVALQASAHKEYDSTKNDLKKIRKFSFGYGVQLAVNAGKQSQIFLPEAYVKFRFKSFEFYTGRRKEIVGLVDTTLGAGSFIWSGNALPMPKVQIAIPNYTSIIGHGLISIKGAYVHGWFGNQHYTKGYYLHQKWIYGKIGRDSWNVNFYGGINHQVQWGGYSEIFKDNTFYTRDGFFSADPFVYLNIVLPFGWKIPPNARYNGYETLNRFGNHLGSVDLGVLIKTSLADISFYRQTPYEDGQMPEVFLSMDGNYSLSFDFKNEKQQLYKINFGYIDSRRQGKGITKFAKWIGKKETHYGERQDYFNHGQYRDGWAYLDNSIGNALILPNIDLVKKIKLNEYPVFTVDNRIQAYYIALMGKAGKYNYEIKSSLVSSLGSFSFRRDKNDEQFSSLISVSYPIIKQNVNLKFNLALDQGQLYGKNIGISFFIIKKW